MGTLRYDIYEHYTPGNRAYQIRLAERDIRESRELPGTNFVNGLYGRWVEDRATGELARFERYHAPWGEWFGRYPIMGHELPVVPPSVQIPAIPEIPTTVVPPVSPPSPEAQGVPEPSGLALALFAVAVGSGIRDIIAKAKGESK